MDVGGVQIAGYLFSRISLPLRQTGILLCAWKVVVKFFCEVLQFEVEDEQSSLRNEISFMIKIHSLKMLVEKIASHNQGTRKRESKVRGEDARHYFSWRWFISLLLHPFPL